jgi:hypothetical protein
MKKIYLMAAMLISGATVFAQGTLQTQNKGVIKRVMPVPVSSPAQSTTPTDTAGWAESGNFAPVFAGISGEVVAFGYLGGGWIYGNNVGDPANGVTLNECAQGYLNVNQSTLGIEEVLMLFTGKTGVSGSATSKAVVKVYSMAANKARNTDGAGGQALNSPGPNQLLGSQDYFFDDIDTTFGNWNIVTFPSPIFVNGTDFAISVDFTNLDAAGDTAGLLCDQVGDADGLDYAFHKVNGSQWYVTDFAFSASGTDDVDNDIAIFTVIDENYIGVESPEFFNGMKLSQNNPNPMNGNTVIQYELEKYTTAVELEIFDVHGRKAVVINEGEKTAGRHSISIENTKLAAGTYYYSLKANGNRLTKKMVVTK